MLTVVPKVLATKLVARTLLEHFRFYVDYTITDDEYCNLPIFILQYY